MIYYVPIYQSQSKEQMDFNMQIVLLADIHANYRALQAVLDKYSDADEVWCLGDIMEFGPCPTQCLELVRKYCDYVIQGNHDVSYAMSVSENHSNVWVGCDGLKIRSSDMVYLLNLPQSITLSIGEVSYYLVHGSPQNPLAGIFWPHSEPQYLREAVNNVDADVIICGHSHMAMILPFEHKTIVNVGTVRQPRDGDFRAQCMVLEDGVFRFDRVAYDLTALESDYVDSSLPESLQREWLDYTRRGVVDVHGLQLGPFSKCKET